LFCFNKLSLILVEESESTPNGITRVTIKSSTADKGPPIDLILCNLCYPSCLQQPLDIEFYEGQTLTFSVKGPCKYYNLIIKNDRFLLDKVHLTGYVLQPEPQESKKLILLKGIIGNLFIVHEEGHLPVSKSGDFFAAAGESSSDDDDDDDDDESDDDDDDIHLARRHRLRDDEVN
jgi:hypothetical protein